MGVPLPKQYAWLSEKAAPRLIVEFVKLYGIREIPGSASNPVILGWAKALGLKDYTNDGIAWCGLMMAWLCHLCDKPLPALNCLWALNWATWGIEVEKGDERLGDLLVFKRYDAAGKLIGGHIGIYIAEDDTHFHVGGGNESDMANIVRIAKGRLFACRRPQYVNQPADVAKVFMDASGIVSTNEA